MRMHSAGFLVSIPCNLNKILISRSYMNSITSRQDHSLNLWHCSVRYKSLCYLAPSNHCALTVATATVTANGISNGTSLTIKVCFK